MEENKSNEIPSKRRGGSPERQKERENSINTIEPKGKIKNIKPYNSGKKEDSPKDKKKINKQVVIIIITIIIGIILTTTLIILKFKSLNEKYRYVEENQNVFESKDKIEDPDSIYILKTGDKIDYNDINIDEKYYYNGQEYNFTSSDISAECSQYVEISGLKNKEIENNINNRIKQKAMEHSRSYTHVIGNFSNILSILTSYYDDNNSFYETINIDLNTGNDLKFEDLFAKSTPIYSIIYNGFLEKVAWDIDIDRDNYSSDREFFEARKYALNMNNRDTSYYEDYLYKLIDEYNRNKDDLVFTISNTGINIYGFKSDGTYDKTQSNGTSIKIPLYRYKDYVTAFKKYSGGDLYENQVTIKGVHSFYKNTGYSFGSKLNGCIYQETDNMILDICSYIYNKEGVYNKNLSNKIKSDLQQYIDMANQDKSNFYVIQAFSWGDSSEEGYNYWNNKYYISYYSGSVVLSVVKIPVNKIEKLNEYFAKVSEMPNASVDPYMLCSFVTEDNDFTIIKSDERYNMYFDSNGNYLGDNEDVVVDYSKSNNQYGQS